MRTILAVAVLAALVCTEAHAWPRSRRSSGTSSVPSGHSNATAQDVAQACAATGRLAHIGNPAGGYEGLGMASTKSAAYANCCYANSGKATVDVGYAQSASGMWFCCRRYR